MKPLLTSVLVLMLAVNGWCEEITKELDGKNYKISIRNNRLIIATSFKSGAYGEHAISLNEILGFVGIFPSSEVVGEAYIYAPKNYSGDSKNVWHWIKIEKKGIMCKEHKGEIQIKHYSTPSPGGSMMYLWIPIENIIYYPNHEDYLNREKRIIEDMVRGKGAIDG